MPEKCKNCRAAIGELETPHVWRDQVVCGPCYGRLSTAGGSIPYASPHAPPPREADPPPPPPAPARWRIRWKLVAAELAVVIAIVAGVLLLRAPEPTYKGLPQSYWLAQVHDKDESTRAAAYAALAEFDGKDEAIAASLREAMHREFGDTRWLVAKTYLLKTGDNAPVIASIREDLKSREQVEFWTTSDRLEDLLDIMGPRARGLIPDLKRFKAKVPSDAANDGARKDLDRVIAVLQGN